MPFIELQTEEGNSNRLSGVSLREEHTATWEELRFILWLFVEDDDLVVEQHKGSVGQPSLEDPGGRVAERDPHGQLTPITEEPSELSEDSLFVHDEPDMQHAAVRASQQYLQCISSGDWDDMPELVESDSEDDRDVPTIDDELFDEVEEVLREQGYLNLGGGCGAINMTRTDSGRAWRCTAYP